MTAEELGELYDEKRRAWEEATGAEGFGDEYAIEVARRLDGLQFEPPEFDWPVDERGPVCRRCGVPVSDRDLHTRWHELVSAGIKLAQYEANLGHLGAAFLGIALRELFGDEVLTGAAPAPAEQENWTPSGHGHLYPLPNGLRARCGGPGMCAKCKADLEHSERVGDGEAERWLQRVRAEGGPWAGDAAREDTRPLGDSEVQIWRVWIREHPEQAVRIACGADHDAVVAGLEGEWGTLGTILAMIEPLDQDTRARVLESALVRVTASETVGPVSPNQDEEPPR